MVLLQTFLYMAEIYCSKNTSAMTETEWSPADHVPERFNNLITSKLPLDSMLAFTQILRLLKTQPRTGWIDKGIPVAKTESISDHMYRMSLISMALPTDTISIDKCVKIALIHDIAEALVGDITPFGGVTKEEKHRRESATIDYLVELMREYNPRFAREMKELWLAYENILCLEARYVKDIDKLEMITQAWEYEQDYGIKYDLHEFYNARKSIETQTVGDLCDELISQRTAYIAKLKEEQQ